MAHNRPQTLALTVVQRVRTPLPVGGKSVGDHGECRSVFLPVPKKAQNSKSRALQALLQFWATASVFY
jgi:hypothetical protein